MKLSKKVAFLLPFVLVISMTAVALANEIDEYYDYKSEENLKYGLDCDLEKSSDGLLENGLDGSYEYDMAKKQESEFEKPEFPIQIMPFTAEPVSNWTDLLDVIANPPVGTTSIVLTNPITIPVGFHEINTALPITAVGGGFIVPTGAELTLNNVTLTGGTGTGVDVNGGEFIMENSTISNFNNRGVVVRNNGAFFMDGGAVSYNTLTGAGWGGSGVYVVGTGSEFTMHSGEISGNNSGSLHGGGVIVRNGAVFTMNDGIITENQTTGRGGGVSVHGGDSTFIMNGGTISNNNAATGGGVNVEPGTFNMNGGKITDHTINGHGGGVNVLANGIFNMSGGIIYGNTSNHGGGVWTNGTFNMINAPALGEPAPTIGNSTANNTANIGGGVYVLGGIFTMGDGTSVSNNTANSGGGVFLANNNPNVAGPATLVMNGGKIAENTANANGGGVLLYGVNSSFTLHEGLIYNNNTQGHGGGVLVRGNDASVTIHYGTISNNTAGGNGGAIALWRNGLDVTAPNLALEGQALTIKGGNIIGNEATNGGGLGFVLQNNAPVDVFVQYLSNTTIAQGVIFGDNVAAISRPNLYLFENKSNIEHCTVSLLSVPYDVGRFTNHDIHTPRRMSTIAKTANPNTNVTRGSVVTYRFVINTSEFTGAEFLSLEIVDVLNQHLIFNPGSIVVIGASDWDYEFYAPDRRLTIYNIVLEYCPIEGYAEEVIITFTVRVASNAPRGAIDNTVRLFYVDQTDPTNPIDSAEARITIHVPRTGGNVNGGNGDNGDNGYEPPNGPGDPGVYDDEYVIVVAPQVPLAGYDEEEVNLPEPTVPLGNIPQTNAAGSGIGWVIVSLMALGAITLTSRKRKYGILT